MFSIELCLDPVARRKGLWKLNTSHIHDKHYCEKINSFWELWRTKKSSFHTLSAWWEAGKQKIKAISIRFSTNKKRSQNRYEKKLEKQLQNTRRKMDSLGRAKDTERYHRIKSKLANIVLERAKGDLIRARAAWHESGETVTEYFVNQARKQAGDNTIGGIKTPDGRVVTDSSQLLSEQSDFIKTFLPESTQNLRHRNCVG